MTDRWKRLIPPIAGVALVALFVIAMSLLSGSPGAGDSGEKVRTYFASHHGRTVTTAVMMTYAAAMALVFYTGMAAHLRRRGSQLLAALTTAGGIVMATSLLVAAGLLSAVIDHPSTLSNGTLQALNQIGSDAPWIGVLAGSALATLAIGIASLRTRALPKALGIITVVVGVVQISGILSWWGFLASGPLTLVLAGYLYQRTGQADSITMPDVPAQRVTAEEPTTATSRSGA